MGIVTFLSGVEPSRTHTIECSRLYYAAYVLHYTALITNDVLGVSDAKSLANTDAINELTFVMNHDVNQHRNSVNVLQDGWGLFLRKRVRC